MPAEVARIGKQFMKILLKLGAKNSGSATVLMSFTL
jgi:hypothetical protein